MQPVRLPFRVDSWAMLPGFRLLSRPPHVSHDTGQYNIVDQQILHRHSPSFRIGVLLGEGATQSFQTKPSTALGGPLSSAAELSTGHLVQ
jgi:hypothetical protein